VLTRCLAKFIGVPYSKNRVKFLVLSALSTGLIAFGHIFFLGTCAVGFAVAKKLGAKETGRPGKIPSVILPLGVCRLHLHHWLMSSMAMAFILPWFFPSAVLYGFLGGVAAQGIYCYSDWHRVLILGERSRVPCVVAEADNVTVGPLVGPELGNEL